MTTEEIAAKLTPDELMNAVRKIVLDALTQVEDEGWCLNLHGLQVRTGFPKETLRGIIADLREDGLAAYYSGLWTEDGTPGGAGYAITNLGRAVLAALGAKEPK